MKRYHFVGIGGIGMSGLAAVMMADGAEVSGSDVRENRETEKLRRAGAIVRVGHDSSHVDGELDGIIVSSAISADNVEIEAARRYAIPVVRRVNAMAELLRKQKSIGVAGTHGKSTTTAMLATILQRVGRDPSYLIGAECPGLAGGNAHRGRGQWFVSEIDESDGLLVDVRTDVAVLTNVGRDHLQTYRDLDDIIRSFDRFMRLAEATVWGIDDQRVAEMARRVDGAFTAGLGEQARLRATNVRFDRFRTLFDLRLDGALVCEVLLPAPGEHNVRNALCALGAAHVSGIDLVEAAEGLSHFWLPHRRFELLEENGVTVVDDYAHLPEEIDATLAAIRSGWPERRILAVFQPHRFSRTQALGAEFGRAFALADTVVVTSIYPACEAPLPGVTSDTVSRAISRETHADVHSIPSKPEVLDFLRRHIRPGDFIISFGAGDIWTVTEELACFLKEGSFCVPQTS